MLKGIDPLLDADILYLLRAMGHGDTVVLVDANFPARAVAASCVVKAVPTIAVDAPTALKAILSVMPVEAAARMEVIDEPDSVPETVAALQDVLDAAREGGPMRPIERFAFYEEARGAFAIIATAERRFYGNAILTKGVVPLES